jgi:hypothetical protein
LESCGKPPTNLAATPHSEIIVLLAGEPPLGLALFRLRPSLWSKAADVYLEELYVVPERRGQGIREAEASPIAKAPSTDPRCSIASWTSEAL